MATAPSPPPPTTPPPKDRVLFLVELEGSNDYERQYAQTAAEAVRAAQGRGLPAVAAYRPDPAEILLTLCDEVRAVRDQTSAQRAMLESVSFFARTAEAQDFRYTVRRACRIIIWWNFLLFVLPFLAAGIFVIAAVSAGWIDRFLHR